MEKDLIEKTGYSYSGLIDVIEDGKLPELLRQMSHRYDNLKSDIKQLEEQLSERERNLSALFHLMEMVKNKMYESGKSESNKIAYVLDDEVIIIDFSGDSLKYCKYPRIDT